MRVMDEAPSWLALATEFGDAAGWPPAVAACAESAPARTNALAVASPARGSRRVRDEAEVSSMGYPPSGMDLGGPEARDRRTRSQPGQTSGSASRVLSRSPVTRGRQRVRR